ncbi:hypothetical protein EHS13_01875 [Paenibacillus psychroresistens]|uniref:Uncharacterized protein n=1 Tax=Paenibacillus psychroresistens TaxID=1778678 RepID=A0A6B8RAK0_9BACL|nr:hypothetical protein [Paenibacillus psychroresistens]QGQ93741.1 hypothetical protein EHS13_01875 [Paenibacillus psychroresistens]
MNIEKFVNKVLSEDHEYDDNYNKTLDEISENNELLIQLAELIETKVHVFNVSNGMKVEEILYDIVITREKKVPEFYPILLNMMYQEYSCNVSFTYKYIDQLIFIKSDITEVFQDIIKYIEPNEATSACISLFALYSPLGEFNNFDENLIVEYLKKILESLRINNNHDYLKKAVKNQLINKIQNIKYVNYLSQFKLLLN